MRKFTWNALTWNRELVTYVLNIAFKKQYPDGKVEWYENKGNLLIYHLYYLPAGEYKGVGAIIDDKKRTVHSCYFTVTNWFNRLNELTKG